jgi:hypothetical protein
LLSEAPEPRRYQPDRTIEDDEVRLEPPSLEPLTAGVATEEKMCA